MAEGKLTLDMSDVAKQLAKLPAMTSEESEKAVRALTASFDRAARESKKLAKQVEADSKAFQSIQKEAQQAGPAMSKLAASIGLISPELKLAAEGAAKVAGGVEAVAASGGRLAGVMGPVAVAVAAAAAAYFVLNAELKDAEAVQARSAATATALMGEHRKLEDARLSLAVATGELTAEEARAQSSAMATERALGDLATANEAQRKELDAAASSGQKWLDIIDATIFKLNPLVKGLGWAADQLMGWTRATEAAASGNAELDRREKAMAATITATAKAREDAAKATDAQREAARAAADAEREAAKRASEAQRARAAAAAERERAETQAAQAIATATQTLARIEQTRADALLSKGDLFEIQAQREIEAIKAITAEHVGNEAIKQQAAEATAAVEASVAQRRMEQAATAAAAQAEIEAANQAGLQAKITETDSLIKQYDSERVEGAKAVAGALGGLAGDVSQALFAASEEQAKHNKKAAKRTFAIAKGLAISEVIVKTAQAVMAVWAQWAGVPPVAAALAGVTIATGAMQAGKIAASEPKFHSGGVYNPDEGPARLRRGEGVLTPQAVRNAGGAEAIRRMNRNEAPAPAGRLIIDWRDGAKGLTRTMADLSRSRSRVLSDSERSYSGRNWSR